MKLLRYYGERGLRIVRAYMQYVWDDRGRRYIDAHTGHGVAFLGHNNPRIVGRLRDQIETLMTCNPSFRCAVQDEAIGRLEKIAPQSLDTVAFTNSGAEAVETALKMAWAYTGRKRIVAFKGGFHGRTLAALSVTWNPAYRRGFPVLDSVTFIDYNSPPGSLDKVVSDDVAAVIVEPVLGEGGVVPATRDFMRAVSEAASKAGALLIIDEIQTGFGRCGRIWCHELYGVKPDILLAGKALGGGFPVAAVMASWDVASKLTGGRHGSTFAGNPLALAAVAAAVDVLLGDNVPHKAAMQGEHLLNILRRELTGLKPVRDVRGLGLMIGVELRYQPLKVLQCLQSRGVLALKAGTTVVRLLPPYMISQHDIEVIAYELKRCICSIHGC